jgi:hypothetical protein
MIEMRILKVGALIALMARASGCARNVTTPGAPDPGFSGGPGAMSDLGAVTGGTLPGTNISDRVLFTVDRARLAATLSAS